MEIPEELQVLLEQDREENNYFQGLTKGRQKNLIFIVSKFKSTHNPLNIYKALANVEHLKQVKMELDFKKLMEMIKYYNYLQGL
ncbi:YdeI/OmpD-associated family protein [Echinicola jeungdonensis]|uniref:YdeI/OmpD-associated family protein n=1 Tax=Echinicola jeungdonensis TaxID=709343 RepID=A0ABV5J5W1_9BACT|nr:YdeI/OmpD-associated family protein [Echinicola jeungdonensis]MDN3670949.1 YdeI/OmpD-associated family protein [Echinicola jeungdonensis]